MSLALVQPQTGDEQLVVINVVPESIPAFWPFVRRGLVAIGKRQDKDYPDRRTWTPEHVFQSLSAKQSELWVVGRNRMPCGFTVTQIVVDPFQHVNKGLFIWMAWNDPHEPDAVGCMDAYLSQVARDRCLTYLEALTTRPGLARRMNRHGWEQVMVVIRKDLYKEE